MKKPPLTLTAEEMREAGYRVIDAIVDHLTTLPEQRVGSIADLSELDATPPPVPEHGADFADVLAEVQSTVLASTMHLNHPRFFAYVPGPGNFVSVMADAIAAAWNVFSGAWMSGSGAALVERTIIDWLRRECALPPSAGGVLVSGGTMANLTGLAVARHVRLGGVRDVARVYCSDQAHSSILKSLRVLGFADDQLRVLPAAGDFRLRSSDLAQAIDDDLARGFEPFCVVGTAGTTNTGAIDPLEEIAALCREHDLWFHVDGAYGAAAVLSGKGRALLNGLELVDSMAMDPHKWLFQPFELGCTLLRNRAHLNVAFEIIPEYLKDTHHTTAELNYMDRGIQLTRSFRALKLWMSLRTFGASAFREAIERGFELAELAERTIRTMSAWEVVTPAQMAIFTFRFVTGDDTFHLRLVQRIAADGFALITSTVLHGRTVLRMCTINPRTTEADIVETLTRVDQLARGN